MGKLFTFFEYNSLFYYELKFADAFFSNNYMKRETKNNNLHSFWIVPKRWKVKCEQVFWIPTEFGLARYSCARVFQKWHSNGKCSCEIFVFDGNIAEQRNQHFNGISLIICMRCSFAQSSLMTICNDRRCKCADWTNKVIVLVVWKL